MSQRGGSSATSKSRSVISPRRTVPSRETPGIISPRRSPRTASSTPREEVISSRTISQNPRTTTRSVISPRAVSRQATVVEPIITPKTDQTPSTVKRGVVSPRTVSRQARVVEPVVSRSTPSTVKREVVSPGTVSRSTPSTVKREVVSPGTVSRLTPSTVKREVVSPRTVSRSTPSTVKGEVLSPKITQNSNTVRREVVSHGSTSRQAKVTEPVISRSTTNTVKRGVVSPRRVEKEEPIPLGRTQINRRSSVIRTPEGTQTTPIRSQRLVRIPETNHVRTSELTSPVSLINNDIIKSFLPPSLWAAFQPPKIVNPGDKLTLPNVGEKLEFPLDPPLTINLDREYNWDGKSRSEIHVYKVEVQREEPLMFPFFLKPPSDEQYTMQVYHDGGLLEIDPKLANIVQHELEDRYRAKLKGKLQWSNQGSSQRQVVQMGTGLQSINEIISENFITLKLV